MPNDESNDRGGDGQFTPPGTTVETVGPLDLPVLVPDPEQLAIQMEASTMDATPDGGAEMKAQQDVDDPIEYLDNAVSLGESFNEHVDRAIEAEDCAFCKRVLRDLKDRPTSEQVTGIRELRRLKDEITTGEMPSKEELSELVGDFEVVDLGGQV